MFKSLFGKKPLPSSETKSEKLSSGIAQSILDALGARSIPTMASAAQKAFQLATDPKADARDFIEVIESDEGLSARVLKIANSVYFDRGKKSTTIEQSVVVIGINELRSLLNATTLSEIFPSRHPIRSQLWANDLGTAIISKALAQRFAPSKVDLAFLGGLMHDVGKLLIIQKLGDEYRSVITKIEQTGTDFCSAEVELFPFNHCDVGRLIGERWNFSPELNSIIGSHHQSWGFLQKKYGANSLVGLTKAADIICHALAIGHPSGFHRFQNKAVSELEEMWNYLNIQQSEQGTFLKELEHRYTLERDIYT